MSQINPYLNFNGNTEEAFNFYKSVFGGEFSALMRFGETPGCDPEGKLTEDEKQKVMHVSLPIGNNVLMGTDAIESMSQRVEPGTNFSIAVTPDSREEADRLFNELGDGGNVVVPLQDMFWGDYFGLITDKLGIAWMVNFDPKRA